MDEFRNLPDPSVLDRLFAEAVQRGRVNEEAQLGAWRRMLPILREACSGLSDATGWRVLLEFEVPRLGGRIDAVLVSPRAVFVLEFKVGAHRLTGPDREQAAGYALDLQDFHAGSRGVPIVPILVATQAPAPRTMMPLLIGGVTSVLDANSETLAALLGDLDRQPAVGRPVRVEAWESARYEPVPNVIEAACRLYAGHQVAEITQARADATNLTLTSARIAAILQEARQAGRKVALFVTGIPGAGKTLCGLAASFATAAHETRASFLTGNPSLVHVLREALTRDRLQAGSRRTDIRHWVEGVIQPLPRFRDLYVENGHVPAERVIVVDEAQRCWTAAYAQAKTRDRRVPLTQSEPAHLLDVMARQEGFAGLVCLIGNGQEIHDGEGGLAAWGEALADRPAWQVAGAPDLLDDPEPRNRLPRLPDLRLEPALHLSVPLRSLRHDAAPRWVDAVLRGDELDARAIAAAEGRIPFRLTRDPLLFRSSLRASSRGIHRCGLVASASARRLRAEGFGFELPHMDEDAVSRWFLDSWLRNKDVRASDALELVATQFSVQGLELDHVGLCWDGDLIRVPGERAWQVRSFRGTRWQVARHAEKIAWRLNSYRVLLTRARFETILWVPRGDPADPSRDPDTFDRIADFLTGCGVPPVEPLRDGEPARRVDEPALL